MSSPEVRGAANAAKGAHDTAAAIDAHAARQSRCDANAAMGTWMLAMQQCHKSSKAHDTIAAKRMHAVVAAIHLALC